MKPLLKREYERSKKLARELEATGDLSSAFIALERAHILGQRYGILSPSPSAVSSMSVAFLRMNLAADSQTN